MVPEAVEAADFSHRKEQAMLAPAMINELARGKAVDLRKGRPAKALVVDPHAARVERGQAVRLDSWLTMRMRERLLGPDPFVQNGMGS
jgi:hypothetical protein